ncbi:xylulokinase [Salimicrobium halophilum]|uniref:Xylulose kinase n=1 Tax=Salimicrobium halophilum TaxID=86666 RepID=A0A1G8SA92_9BACI|nr:xylulokinase [Salimicrobium halophilum]SDJ26139.1 xylulokinase [Salimicrobium halophilum]
MTATDKVLLAIDIGTSSAKCVAMNKKGELVAEAAEGYSTSRPHHQWVEQSPECWWTAVSHVIKKCVGKLEEPQVEGISLSGHMSALVLVDGSGSVLRPSILITDNRSTRQTEHLNDLYKEEFIKHTGNQPMNAFTAPKLLWVKENEPEIFAAIDKLMFPKDYIRYKLTGEIGTDPTDAGNSLLLNVKERKWNEDLIQKVGLPNRIFPEIHESLTVFGYVSDEAARETGMVRRGTPVVTGGADMACSHIGTGAYLPGTSAITLSTSGQVVMSAEEIDEKKSGKVTYHPGAVMGTMYAMGTVFTGGLGVEWGYKLLYDRKEMNKGDYERIDELSEEMKRYPPGSEGLVFLPFLVGSSTPYFDSKDRAAWIGLTIGQRKSLLLHSILEGITFNLQENLHVLQGSRDEQPDIFLGGGGSRNDVWVQMIADVTNSEVKRLISTDGSTMGAAIIGGVALSWFPSVEEALAEVVKAGEEFVPDVYKHYQYRNLFEGYQTLYKSLNHYYHKYS